MSRACRDSPDASHPQQHPPHSDFISSARQIRQGANWRIIPVKETGQRAPPNRAQKLGLLHAAQYSWCREFWPRGPNSPDRAEDARRGGRLDGVSESLSRPVKTRTRQQRRCRLWAAPRSVTVRRWAGNTPNYEGYFLRFHWPPKRPPGTWGDALVVIALPQGVGACGDGNIHGVPQHSWLGLS